MRIDPAQSIEVEIADLRKHITDLKRECLRLINFLHYLRGQAGR